MLTKVLSFSAFLFGAAYGKEKLGFHETDLRVRSDGSFKIAVLSDLRVGFDDKKPTRYI